MLLLLGIKSCAQQHSPVPLYICMRALVYLLLLLLLELMLNAAAAAAGVNVATPQVAALKWYSCAHPFPCTSA
jgi:hypothetical protein